MNTPNQPEESGGTDRGEMLRVVAAILVRDAEHAEAALDTLRLIAHFVRLDNPDAPAYTESLVVMADELVGGMRDLAAYLRKREAER